MTVAEKTIPDDEEFIGQTESFQPIEVRSQVTGIIKKVFFTEGRDVRKGDRLYRIDPVPFRASVSSAKGQVGQALARLARARAELALMETHRLHLVSVVQLYKALGGGWLQNSSA